MWFHCTAQAKIDLRGLSHCAVPCIASCHLLLQAAPPELNGLLLTLSSSSSAERPASSLRSAAQPASPKQPAASLEASSTAAQPASKRSKVSTCVSAARPATLLEQVEQLGHFPKRCKKTKTDKERQKTPRIV